MTTTDRLDKTEVITKALADLEALRQLDICDPLELTRPFRQWTARLNTIGETLRDVEFAATIDAEVRRRVENILEEMSAAARLVETSAMSVVLDSHSPVSAGVRTWFETALELPHIYSSLTSADLLLGTEPTAAETGEQLDAELVELREAIKRGDIVVPRTAD